MDIIKKLIALFGGNKLVDQKMPVADQDENDAGDNGADDAGAPTLSLAPDTSKPSEEQRSEPTEVVSQNEAGPVTVEVQAPAVIEKPQQRPADKSEDPRETEYPAEAFLTSHGCEIKSTSERHLEDVLIDYEKKSVGKQYAFTAPEEIAESATQQAATESDTKTRMFEKLQGRAQRHALDSKGKQLPDVSRHIEAVRKRNEEMERNRELQQQQQQNRSQGPSLKM